MGSRAENWSPPVPAMLPARAWIVRALGEIDELAAPWNSLGGEGGCPHLSHAWVRACAASFAGSGELSVVVVGAPNALALAPLIRRDDVVPRLELLGVDELGEPSDLLAADPSALALLADALVRTGQPVHLKRIPADSATVPALRRAYRGRGVVISRPHAAYPWIPLDATWTSPEERLSARRRSDVRRARRIAAGMGPVSIEVVSPAPAEVGPLIEEAFLVEAASWKGRRGSAVLNDAARAAFYRQYAFWASERGILRLGFLRIGGRPAAMQLAVESGERFWLLKIGYDESFARCSPGTLLMLEALRCAVARGLRSYELLGAVEPWTLMWTQLARPCVSLRAYPATAPGIGALMMEVARMGGRKLGRRLRNGWLPRKGSCDPIEARDGQRPERNAEDMLGAAG